MCEGRGRDETVAQAVEDVRRLGYQAAKVLLNTDNAPALVDLRRAVAEALGTQAVLEAPPAYVPPAVAAQSQLCRLLAGTGRWDRSSAYRRALVTLAPRSLPYSSTRMLPR